MIACPATILIGLLVFAQPADPLPVGIPWSDFEVSKLREIHPAMWERIDAARSSTTDEIRDMLRSDNLAITVKPSLLAGIPTNHLVAERLAEVDHLAWAQIDNARRSESDRVREMLRSNDPKVVSLGIYAASAQCRPDLLIEAVWLVGDERTGLPRLAQESLQGELVVQDTPTIDEYFRQTLGFWVRGLPHEPAALRAALEARPDPWRYVSAWQARLERLAVEQRRDELLEARRHLREQPETVQWIVATMPQLNPELYPTLTEDDTRAILWSLSPEIKRRIADRTIELPPDIAPLREKNPKYLESFFTRYEQAVAAPD